MVKCNPNNDGKIGKKVFLFILCFFIIFIISCQRRKRQRLYLFNWTDYMSPEVIKKFEQRYDCRVIYDMFSSNEDMFTRVIISKARYDLIVSSGDYGEIMRRRGLLHRIDKPKLQNYHHLDPLILQKAQEFDPGNNYAVPYFWGTAGFIYNKKYLSEARMKDVSWNIIADASFTGKRAISMLDDAREVVGTALIYCGYTPNTLDDTALAGAREVLLQWDKNISHFDSDAYKNEVQDGTIWLGQSYNGDALQIMSANPDVGFTLPKEGSTLWIDSLIIPETSENKELAYQFIDFLLDTENALQNASYVQYATPVKTAQDQLPEDVRMNPSIYPTAGYLAKCHLIKNIGEGVLKIDRIWREVRE